LTDAPLRSYLDYLNSELPGILIEIPGGFLVHMTLKRLFAPNLSPGAKMAAEDDLNVYLMYIPAEVAEAVREYIKLNANRYGGKDETTEEQHVPANN